MLNPAQLSLRKRSKTRPQYRIPDAKRAGAIVIEARAKLKEFADAELPDGRFSGINMTPTVRAYC